MGELMVTPPDADPLQSGEAGGAGKVAGMTTPHHAMPFPAFEDLPSATDIAHWFVEEMRGEQNVGGDAWWLSRDPHSSCRMLAFVDYDVQEFWLLDIATGDTKDLLWVTAGLDGLWCEWWQHPVSESDGDPDWIRDGIGWMAELIVVHLEAHAAPMAGDTRRGAGRSDQ